MPIYAERCRMGKLKTDCRKLQKALNKYNRTVVCEITEDNNICHVRPGRRNEKTDFFRRTGYTQYAGD
jgi:hypothetical protein